MAASTHLHLPFLLLSIVFALAVTTTSGIKINARLHAGSAWILYAPASQHRDINHVTRLALKKSIHPSQRATTTTRIAVRGSKGNLVDIRADSDIPKPLLAQFTRAAFRLANVWGRRRKNTLRIRVAMQHLGGADVLALVGGVPVVEVSNYWGDQGRVVPLPTARLLLSERVGGGINDAQFTLNSAARWSTVANIERLLMNELYGSMVFAGMKKQGNAVVSSRLSMLLSDRRGCSISSSIRAFGADDERKTGTGSDASIFISDGGDGLHLLSRALTPGTGMGRLELHPSTRGYDKVAGRILDIFLSRANSISCTSNTPHRQIIANPATTLRVSVRRGKVPPCDIKRDPLCRGHPIEHPIPKGPIAKDPVVLPHVRPTPPKKKKPNQHHRKSCGTFRCCQNGPCCKASLCGAGGAGSGKKKKKHRPTTPHP